MTSSLEIRLLGVPQISINGSRVDGLRRKNRALVDYLSAHERQPLREKLLSFFWPDKKRSSAQVTLRTMIHALHSSLGDAFQADNRSVALSSDASIDLQFFITGLDQNASNLQKMVEVLAVYRGDFLEGFTLPDSPQFDDWATSERERYQLAAMDGFAALARLHEGQGNYENALESMRRALEFNPFREDLQREVMRLLYINGDRAGVMQQYESLRKLLDEVMGIPPMPETRTLYDAIINETFILPSNQSTSHIPAAARPAAKPLLPFLGRDAELETLGVSYWMLTEEIWIRGML